MNVINGLPVMDDPELIEFAREWANKNPPPADDHKAGVYLMARDYLTRRGIPIPYPNDPSQEKLL